MTAFPEDPTKEFLDNLQDDPKQALAELENLVNKFVQLNASLKGLFGATGDKVASRQELGLGTLAVLNKIGVENFKTGNPGEIIVVGENGSFFLLPPGQPGQTLTIPGADLPPVWTDQEGAFEKIGTINIDAVSSLNIVFDPSTYTEIRIEGKGIKPTDDLSQMRARFGRTDGTVIAGNGSYGTSASSPKDFMDVTFNEIKSAGPGLSFFMSVIGFSDIPILRGHTSYVRASDNVATLGGNNGVLRREVADGHVWDTVQLYFSASNFQAAGAITIYGMKA